MPTITTEYKGDALFETELGSHTLKIDVPESMGGKDRAPMPPQLFIASLGSCVGVLVRDFCTHHGLDPEGLKIGVDYEFAKHPNRMTDVVVNVDLPNAHCDDDCTRKALEHVAEHCPVHETIATLNEVKFNIVTG